MRITVGTSNIEWNVDEEGAFYAKFQGEVYKHTTLKGLTEKLRTLAKKKPLDIPFVQFESRWNDDSPELKRGIVTGVHSGNRNLLVRYDDGRTDQVSRYGSSGMLRGDVDAEKLQALWEAQQAACKAYEAFVGAHVLEIPEGEEKE